MTKQNVRQKVNLRDSLEFLAGGIAGFALFLLTSHDRLPVKGRFPARKVKRLQVLPNVKVELKDDKHVHLHHWTLLGSLYVPYLIFRKKIRSKILHGFLLGGIVQGLTYKDRFTFIKKTELSK